jgi:hypothetical protein
LIGGVVFLCNIYESIEYIKKSISSRLGRPHGWRKPSSMSEARHNHLLARDSGGRNIIPDSIKLTAGRTGQEYNIRKNRKGAFWEDRYHATAVEKNRYLRPCITYIYFSICCCDPSDPPYVVWFSLGCNV